MWLRCGACGEGYSRLAGVCQRTPESFAAQARLEAYNQNKVLLLSLHDIVITFRDMPGKRGQRCSLNLNIRMCTCRPQHRNN